VTFAVTASAGGLLAAFGAGMLSFLSPCVLPLVPGYLSVMTGLSVAEMSDGRSDVRRRVLLATAGFIAGFTIVFVALGATASAVGHALVAHKGTLAVVSGWCIIAFGSLLVLLSLPAGFWRRLGPRASSSVARIAGERRFEVTVARLGPFAAPVLGMAFAFAWTPCIGPVLGSVLALAAANSTVTGGIVLLLAYSLGLALPFVLCGLGVARLAETIRRSGRLLALLQGVGGVVLIIFGILLVTHEVAWLADQFTRLLDWLHLSRLTQS
jgi:cytochrome c-type biogenesis protein